MEVRLLFWRNEAKNPLFRNNFCGSEAHRQWLGDLAHPSVRIRWDSSGPNRHHCHHEKSWLVDAGQPAQIGYTGGIIVSNGWVTSQTHSEPEFARVGDRDAPPSPYQKHDVMMGMRGPVCTDLHHSFVQRWNSAIVGVDVDATCFPSPEAADDLPFPTQVVPSHPSGDEELCQAQLQRSIRAGNGLQSTPAVGGREFDIAGGEASILEQYEKAIDAAKDVIYLENQHIAHVCDANCMQAKG